MLDLTQWLFIWTTCTFAWGGSHMHDVITSMWSLVPWQLWLIWLRFSSRKALNVGFFFSNFVYVWVFVLKQDYRNDENDSGPLNQSALIPYHIIWILTLIRVYKQIQGLISLLNFSNYLHASPTLELITLWWCCDTCAFIRCDFHESWNVGFLLANLHNVFVKDNCLGC